MFTGNALDTLNQKYASLTKSEKKIANFVYGNHTEVQYTSITNLAEKCGVAEATVFRFCRSLGFDGYNEFKLALARSLIQSHMPGLDEEMPLYGQVTESDSYTDMCKKLYMSQVNALNHTLDVLKEDCILKATDILLSANRISCIGQGASMITAMEAWSRFVSVSPKFFCIQDTHLQAMNAALLDDTDAILFFSYSGTAKDMVDVLPSAHERGVKVVLITHYDKSPAANYADTILLCGSNEGPLQQGSIAARAAQLLVIDVLFNQFWRKNRVQCEENNEKTSATVVKKLL